VKPILRVKIDQDANGRHKEMTDMGFQYAWFDCGNNPDPFQDSSFSGWMKPEHIELITRAVNSPKVVPSTDHESDKTKLSEHIAEVIYSKLRDLKSDKPIWQHDAHEFLPANVCCDYAGKRGLINSMAREIRQVLDLET
jgi:hypothetical protein